MSVENKEWFRWKEAKYVAKTQKKGREVIGTYGLIYN